MIQFGDRIFQPVPWKHHGKKSWGAFIRYLQYPDAPNVWNIYLYVPYISAIQVGKYTRYMDHMGYDDHLVYRSCRSLGPLDPQAERSQDKDLLRQVWAITGDPWVPLAWPGIMSGDQHQWTKCSGHQLRLVVFNIIYKVFYIPGGCLGFLNHQQYQHH